MLRLRMVDGNVYYTAKANLNHLKDVLNKPEIMPRHLLVSNSAWNHPDIWIFLDHLVSIECMEG